MAIPIQTKFTQITHTPRWRDFNMSGLARKGPKHPGGFNEAKLHCRAGRSWARAAGLLLAAGATTYCAPWSSQLLIRFNRSADCGVSSLTFIQSADKWWWGVWRSAQIHQSESVEMHLVQSLVLSVFHYRWECSENLDLSKTLQFSICYHCGDSKSSYRNQDTMPGFDYSCKTSKVLTLTQWCSVWLISV